MKRGLILLILSFILLWFTGCINKQQTSDPTTETSPETTDELQITKDQFVTINDTVYHRSNKKIYDEFNGEYYYYSEKATAIEWPTELAGCSDISALHDSLICKTFATKFRDASIDKTVKNFVSTAKFLEYADEDISAIRIEKPTTEQDMNYYYESIRIRPSMTSPSLITFSMMHSDYTGGAHGYYFMNHINFDKKSGMVFDNNNSFKQSQIPEVIRIINQYIDAKNETYEHTDLIPDFYLTSLGFTFVFNPYAIACYAEGIVEVDIPYSALAPYLSEDIKSPLKDKDEFSIITYDK